MDKIQKRNVTWSTRGTVTKVSHRKWRVRVRSLSTETAATATKETPNLVQAVLLWSSLNQQYAVKFFFKFSYFKRHKKRLIYEVNKRIRGCQATQKDERCRVKIKVFSIARRIVELATNVTTPNDKLRIQVRMFVTKSSSALSKLMPLKYKQAFQFCSWVREVMSLCWLEVAITVCWPWCPCVWAYNAEYMD